MVTVATFTTLINILLPEPHAGLLSGMLFGTKASLSRDLTESLIASGTLHIVALSGMNIMILSNLIHFSLLRLVSRRVASLLTIGAIIGFVLFVGVSPSIVRAAIMGSITLIGVVYGRLRWALLSWILAVGSMILLRPVWIWDISFQLSALASLGIILFGPNRATDAYRKSSGKLGKDLFDHVRRLVSEDLHVTLAAQALTIPIILFSFHRISFISPIANVLIGWMIAPLTALGLLTVLGGWIWLPIGQLFAWIAWVPLQYLIMVVELTSKIPFASMAW